MDDGLQTQGRRRLGGSTRGGASYRTRRSPNAANRDAIDRIDGALDHVKEKHSPERAADGVGEKPCKIDGSWRARQPRHWRGVRT